MLVKEIARGTVLIWGGATLPAGSQMSPSPVIVEEVGSTSTRVRTHTGESFELPNQRLESTYEPASKKVAEREVERYWKDF